MSQIIIKECKTKKDYKAFVQFPNKLYRNCRQYVCPLNFDEMNFFDRENNHSYEYCESIEFLAYKDDRIVGRISGAINHVYNKKINAKHLRFNHLDMIDDIEVTKALFNAIAKWGKEKGMEEFNGPIGYTDFDRQGMLVEGFKNIGMAITYYNHPYYVRHLEELGFIKDVDWLELRVYIPAEKVERIDRVSSIVTKRYGFELVEFKRFKEFVPYAKDFFNTINKAYEKLHGVVPITKSQADDYVEHYLKLVNFHFIKMVKNKEGEIVGMGILAPSLAKASQASFGKLFPFGWIPLLIALKIPRVLDMYFIAVLPEYQKLGVNAVLMDAMYESARKHHVRYAETGPMLEDNYNILSQWEDFPNEKIRRRRCFVRKIEEFK